MAYVPTKWQDREVQYPRRFTEVYDGDGKRTDTPSPGEVRKAGTPQSATNFNKMESGIQQANAIADLIYSLLLTKVGHSQLNLEEIEEIVAGKLDAAAWTNDNRINAVLRDAEESVRQAIIRDQEERLIVVEAELAALSTT